MTETTFTSECENIVQHICEEHYHVPVPVPVPVPHHHPPHVPFGPAPNPNGRKRRRRKKRSSIMKRKKRASSLERDQLILGLKQALGVPAPPPLLFHQELPAPPGCRSLVTQKCHKVGKNIKQVFLLLLRRIIHILSIHSSNHNLAKKRLCQSFFLVVSSSCPGAC